jgi:GNAT superfamily N-acetyltransferase
MSIGQNDEVAAQVSIRSVRENDRPAWELLWRDFQAFINISLSDETIETTWRRFQDPAEPMFLIGAYLNGKLTGFVHYIFHRSCTTVSDFCYLESLYVCEQARGRGIGQALVESVYAAARCHGANRVYWLVQEANTQARFLYDRVADRSSLILYRKILTADVSPAG